MEARLTAPELGADTLLRVAESKKIDAQWRREILEEALLLSDQVKFPFSRYPVQFKGVNLENSETGMVGLAFRQKLDGLSLKSRIIKQFLSFDQVRAKQIVFSIGGRLGLKSLSCEDTMAYDVTEFYTTVTAVARETYNQKEISEGARALFVTPWIENIESPSQIDGALGIVRDIQGSPVEIQLLSNAFSKNIVRNFNDDRSFTHVLKRGLNPKVERFLSAVSDPSKEDLGSAYRDFLIKNMRGTRCTDNAITKGGNLPPYIVEANKLFPKKPLTIEEVETQEAKGTAKVAEYTKTDFLNRLSTDLRSLNGINEDGSKSVVDKTDLEWQARLNKVVDSLVAWKLQDSETESDIFNLRSTMFQLLIPDVPEGPLRKGIIRRYMRLLNSSSLQKTDFMIWLFQVKSLHTDYPEIFSEFAREFPNSTFQLLLDRKRLGVDR